MRTDRRFLWPAALAGLGYAALYLYAIGDFSLTPPPAWDWRIGELSLDRLLSSRGPFQFEALAIAEAGYAVLLISPLNLLVTAMLGGLLAANIHGALYLRANPGICRPRRGGLIASAAPALLAGGACCAPSLLLILGIPALGAFSAFFGWLVPLSLVALGLNRIWQHWQGAPGMIRAGTRL
jgi:hypothetical protein